jgi:hypothetical protein
MVTIIKLREVKKVTKNIEEIFRTLMPGQERRPAGMISK